MAVLADFLARAEAGSVATRISVSGGAPKAAHRGLPQSAGAGSLTGLPGLV